MLSFELVSPARKLASAEAEAVTIPGMEGDLTAMENHAPFLTTLRPGYVVVRQGSGEDRYFVIGGFAEIADNTVSILAEEAVTADTVTAEWLDARIADAERDHEEAIESRKQASLQRVNDLTTLRAGI